MAYVYKTKHTFESRFAESHKIRDNFPGRIPVIIEKAKENRGGEIPTIDKNKFLVPADLTIGQFIYVVRKRMSLGPEKALFLFVNNSLPPTGAIMRELYAQHADEDGFLYATYGGENTFGAMPQKCTSNIRPSLMFTEYHPQNQAEFGNSKAITS